MILRSYSGQPVLAVEINIAPSLLAPGPLWALPGDAMALGPTGPSPWAPWDTWALPWASWDRSCSVVFEKYYHWHSVHDGKSNDFIIAATIVTVSTLTIPIIIYIDIRIMAQARTCSAFQQSVTFQTLRLGAMAPQNAWRADGQH